MVEEMEIQHPDVDRGWAWVVVGALFLYNILVGGTLKSFGLFYVEFIHLYPEGPAKVGLIGLVFGISSLVMAPLGGVLSDRISRRLIAVVGGVVMAASFSCTALASNLLLAVITFGCLAGGTLGLIDGPILASLGLYFRRKRSIASGLAWTGSSVGNLVLAPLFSWFITEYGIRGAVIILGGIWLHTCVVGFLLRPLPMVMLNGEGKLKVTESLQVSEVECSNPIHEKDSNPDLRLKTSTPRAPREAVRGDAGPQQHSSCLVQRSFTSRDLEVEDSQRVLMVDGETANTVNDKDQHQYQHQLGEGGGYLAFLKNAQLWGTLGLLSCGFFGYYCPFVIIPLLAEELLIPDQRAAWLIAIIGLVEIFSRLILGFIIDTSQIRAIWVLMFSFIIMGIAGQVVAVLSGFWPILIYACAHGLLGGVTHIVMATLLAQVVPLARMGSAMGLVVMVLNLASASVTFLAGLFKELTGSYRAAMQFGSGAYLLGAALYIICRLVRRAMNSKPNSEVRR